MPTQPTYPGVYVEEIPSGVRTIAGVPTSVSAFIGRATRGPVNSPQVINSYGDYERIFGGLSLRSSMSFAVRDYFQNGGGQAVIVRLHSPSFFTDSDLAAASAAVDTIATALRTAAISEVRTATATALTAISNTANVAASTVLVATQAVAAANSAAAVTGATIAGVISAVNATKLLTRPRAVLRLPVAGGTSLSLIAANPGAWGNSLRARVDYDIPSGSAARFNAPSDSALFNLTVRDLNSGVTEVFRNVSVVASTRQLDRVLENESALVRAVAPLPTARPTESDSATGVDLSLPPFVLRPTSATDSTLIEPRSVGVLDADAASDGLELTAASFTGTGLEGRKEGLFALERADVFNLLCISPHSLDSQIEKSLIDQAAAYCERRRAMFIIDPPSNWNTKDAARLGFTATVSDINTRSRNAAVFFPRLIQPNPLRNNQFERFAPCGAVAGIIARTDAQRGIFKAPAGLDATLVGVPDLSVQLTDAENGELNPLGINCLRAMPAVGRVVWGSRTLQGDDRLASEWKYLPVRRMALFIEESLFRGTQWVVFENNDEPLWSQIRLNVGAFMNNLFRQGAFQGATPREAYLVKCDRETTTQNDINLGVVNILVGFAPLKPAEFVFIQLQQIAGQIAT